MVMISGVYVLHEEALLFRSVCWEGLTNFGITKVHQRQAVVLSPLANNGKVHHNSVKLAVRGCVVSYITVRHIIVRIGGLEEIHCSDMVQLTDIRISIAESKVPTHQQHGTRFLT